MIAEAFTDEPIDLGSIYIDGINKQLIVRSISLGVLCRVVGVIVKNWVNLEGKLGDMDSMLSAGESVLKSGPLVIASLFSTKTEPIDNSIATAIGKQWTPVVLFNTLAKVYEKIDIEKLFEHYKFENKGRQTAYPGQGSPWAAVINLAIASKGWGEDSLKWDMSFTNLIMYGMCIPSMKDDSKSDNPAPGEEVDMFDFFDSRG